MAYCGPRGIPYLHFMGGPNEWDRRSRQLAVAWDQHQRGRCRTCGTHPDDWDESRGGDREAFVAVDDWCEGDHLIAKKRRDLGDQAKEGTLIRLVRNPLSPRWQ